MEFKSSVKSANNDHHHLDPEIVAVVDKLSLFKDTLSHKHGKWGQK